MKHPNTHTALVRFSTGQTLDEFLAGVSGVQPLHTFPGGERSQEMGKQFLIIGSLVNTCDEVDV